MPNPVAGLVAGGASLVGSAVQSRASGKAAQAQTAASQQGIEEQRRQFDEMQRLLEPYVAAGQPALEAQQALLGLAGPEAQQAAIQQIESSPLLQALTRQGEEAMLQQASATGGLRGGNLQGALAQFRPAMLQQALEQQYARLGGMTALGQQSAAGVGAAGMESGRTVAGLLGQQGAAAAGGALGRAAPFVQLAGLPMQLAAFQAGRGGSGFGSLFGGSPAGAGVVSSAPGLRMPSGGGFSLMTPGGG